MKLCVAFVFLFVGVCVAQLQSSDGTYSYIDLGTESGLINFVRIFRNRLVNKTALSENCSIELDNELKNSTASDKPTTNNETTSTEDQQVLPVDIHTDIGFKLILVVNFKNIVRLTGLSQNCSKNFFDGLAKWVPDDIPSTNQTITGTTTGITPDNAFAAKFWKRFAEMFPVLKLVIQKLNI